MHLYEVCTILRAFGGLFWLCCAKCAKFFAILRKDDGSLQADLSVLDCHKI